MFITSIIIITVTISITINCTTLHIHSITNIPSCYSFHHFHHIIHLYHLSTPSSFLFHKPFITISVLVIFTCHIIVFQVTVFVSMLMVVPSYSFHHCHHYHYHLYHPPLCSFNSLFRLYFAFTNTFRCSWKPVYTHDLPSLS